MTTPLTTSEMNLLRGIVACFHGNTGKLPSTMQDVVDHWFELQEKGFAEIAKYGEMFSVDDKHIFECIWLRDLQERPDADVLLAQALPAARMPPGATF